MSDFARRVISWQRRHGRHDLPWQTSDDAYRIWLSEVMLQQTQVATVIPYYQRFIEVFPEVASLAAAPLERVLELWSGLGYYSRARHLHAAARQVMETHAGRFPTDSRVLETLPGVGRSTAAAIAVFSASQRAAILDGNVKRVFCRHEAIAGHPSQTDVLAQLWVLAEQRLPIRGIRAYTQGLMDLGATVCTRTRPTCEVCPLAASCQARALGEPTRFPASRPRKTIPLRSTRMLLLTSGDRVLLMRRPDEGIWGGLWSLPECRPEETVDQGARRCLEAAGLAGCPPAAARALTVFEHVFTHFQLRIQPWIVPLPYLEMSSPLASDGYRWLDPASAPAAALPKPIRRLLLALANPPGGSDDLPLFQELMDE